MKAVCIEQFGRPSKVLRLCDLPSPKPSQGEVVVRMQARSVNPSDLIPVSGAYRHRTPLPMIPGYEGVGVIEDTGPGVDSSCLGMRVLPLQGEGTWQELVRAPLATCISVPDDIDNDAASQLYINPLTAWLILNEALNLKQGDIIVINAAGSAFAHILIQLARTLGVRIVAIVRRNLHLARLQALGVFEVIDTSQQPLQSALKELSQSKNIVAALDAIGGERGAALARCLKPGRTFIQYGLLSGEPLALTDKEFSQFSIKGFWLRNWIKSVEPEAFRKAFQPLINLVASGKLAMPAVAARYKLSHFREAVQHASQSGRNGKIILTSR